MPQIQVLLKIAVLVMSFLSGIIVYYLISTDEKAKKKSSVEAIISLTINFIIYIWLGKIIINITKFIRDPLSVLAYPSNADAVYIATILLFINLLYRKFRNDEQLSTILFAFIPVFLISSFVYEFYQLIVERSVYNWLYLVFLGLSSLIYVFVYGKISIRRLSVGFGMSIVIGQFILSLLHQLTVFGYRLSPFYFAGLALLGLMAILMTKRKV